MKQAFRPVCKGQTIVDQDAKLPDLHDYLVFPILHACYVPWHDHTSMIMFYDLEFGLRPRLVISANQCFRFLEATCRCTCTENRA